MKIITLQRKFATLAPTNRDRIDWWCVIETEEEKKLYEDFLEHLGKYGGDPRQIPWNQMVIKAGEERGLCWGDDDVFGYLLPDEDVPEVGEEMVDNIGDVWERID